MLRRTLTALASLLVVAGTPAWGALPNDLPPLFGRVLADFVQTSAAGDRFRPLPPVRFVKGSAQDGIIVRVNPKAPRQTLEGLGGALTESSAYVLAHLAKTRREALLDRCYGPQGARFTLTRTPIGACDFSVRGRFSYDDVPGDVALQHFSIAPDQCGFPGAQDPTYALLPLIKDALTREPRLKLVASPWTAPAWMKDNQDWYGHGVGGALLPQHYDTFARYMAAYLKAYRAEGVPMWAITPINEPLGNSGQWESMEFTDTGLRTYVREHLGPELARQKLGQVKILQFDHNRDEQALLFANTLLGDPATARFLSGTGVHWYSSTNSARTEVLDELHRRFPAKVLLHTEGCIDGIGTADNAPGGAFAGWQNDAWWWTASATDWGFHWAPAEEKADHPRYAPVHRYARDLIQGLNHWLVGWIDWNLVLDRNGGPNHVNNFCAAPLMVDTATEEVHVTPLYYVLAHFSRYLQPGDRITQVTTVTPGLGADDFHATAALSRDGQHLVVIAFNKTPRALPYRIQVGHHQAALSIPAEALQTLRIPLASLR